MTQTTTDRKLPALFSSNPNIQAVREPDGRGGERVRFTGGRFGDHSLNLATRTDVEIRAHWQGYNENNGEQARINRRAVSIYRHNKERTGTVVARIGNEDLVRLRVSTYRGKYVWVEYHVVEAGTDKYLRGYRSNDPTGVEGLPKKWKKALGLG